MRAGGRRRGGGDAASPARAVPLAAAAALCPQVRYLVVDVPGEGEEADGAAEPEGWRQVGGRWYYGSLKNCWICLKKCELWAYRTPQGK